MIGMWLLYNAYNYFSCFTWLLTLNISTSFYEPQLRDCVLFQCTLMADRSWTLAHVYLSFVRMKVNWFSQYRFIWHYTSLDTIFTLFWLWNKQRLRLLLRAYEYLICIIQHQKLQIKWQTVMISHSSWLSILHLECTTKDFGYYLRIRYLFYMLFKTLLISNPIT